MSENAHIELLQQQMKEVIEEVLILKRHSAGLVWNNKNWEAVKQALEENQKQFNKMHEELNAVKTVVSQLQQQFQQFQQQRVLELNGLLNNGPTSKEE